LVAAGFANGVGKSFYGATHATAASRRDFWTAIDGQRKIVWCSRAVGRGRHAEPSGDHEMKRGPRPQPTYLKLLKGNPGKRPLNENEPQPAIPENCPKPPSFLSGHGLDMWWELAPELYRLRLLSMLDVAPLAAFCVSYARWRESEELLQRLAVGDPMHGLLIKHENTVEVNPLVSVSRKAAEQMIRIAGEFGMSPAARTRIAAGVGHQSNFFGKFDGLIGDGA
jgi:P27 family predicted phage terminase small subunit